MAEEYFGFVSCSMCGTVTRRLQSSCKDVHCPKECHLVSESEIGIEAMCDYFGRNSLPKNLQHLLFDPEKTQPIRPYGFDGEKTQPIPGVVEQY